jgi:hypothetical protein
MHAVHEKHVCNSGLTEHDLRSIGTATSEAMRRAIERTSIGLDFHDFGNQGHSADLVHQELSQAILCNF